MFPKPPAVSAVGYSDLYREYLCRVDACISLRSNLGSAWYAGCSCGINFGVTGGGFYGTKSFKEIGMEGEAGRGESVRDVGGTSDVSCDGLGVGVSEEGRVSCIGETSDRGGCGGVGTADAGYDTIQQSVGVHSDGLVRGKNFLRNQKKKLRDRAKRTSVKGVVDGVVRSSVRPGLSYAGAVVGEASSTGVIGSVSGVVEVEAPGASSVCVDQAVGTGIESFRDVTGFQRSHLESVTTDEERKVLAREWYERKRAENKLAVQRANYNFKRNEYLDRAKISEKKWEQERLSCEQKLARITEARFGSKPGYAETLASISDGSEVPPSLSTGSDSPANLSDGTISPNSSMSVAEANRLIKKVEELSGEVAQLKLEKTALNAAREFSGGSAIVEDGRVHIFDGTGQYVPPSLSGASQPSLCPSDFGF